MRRKGRRWSALLVGLSLAVACGGGDGVGPEASVEPFVGTWDGEVYQIWPDLNPSFIVDVLAEFGDFYITVEPSGQYTAVLEASPVPQVQIGQLSVIGSTIRLDPSTPPDEPTATANFEFTSEDYLVLDGPIEVDFNDDGTRDPGGSHIELRRR